MQLSYNNASLLLHRWLDGYAGFGDTQAAQVRADIDRLHAWHRAEELPHYAQLLERLSREAPSDLSAERVCAVQQQVRLRFARLLEAAEPAIARIAADFGSAQFRQLERKFAQVNRDYWKKWIDASPERQMRERFERALQNAQRIYGTLEEPQRALIRAQLERGSFDAAATYTEMKRRQRDTVETLRLTSSGALAPDALRAAVRGWLERMQHSPDPHYRAHQEQIMRESCDSIAALHNGTTAEQRTEAARRLAGYARDLRGLAAD